MRLRKVYPLLALIVGMILFAWAAPEMWRRVTGKAWDGQQEWWCARLWWDRQDPYSNAGIARINIGLIGHPPTTSFYALPLALFDLSLMGRLVGGLSLGLLFAQLWLMARELRLWSPPATAMLALGLIVHTPFMLYHLGVAQVSELIGFSYFLAWFYLRRDREMAAGVVLGFACTLKAYPGLLVLFLLISRRWRGVVAAAAVWLLAASLMTWRFGLNCWREYLATEKFVVDMWIGHASNATLGGIILRILHPACVADTGADPEATHLATAIGLALVALFWWISRRAMKRTEWLDLPFALFVVTSMFVNVFYWEHYHVILVLPLAIGCAALWQARKAGMSRVTTLTFAVLLAGAAASTLTPPNHARVLLFYARKNAAVHLKAHAFELITSLPMPLLILALSGLLVWFARRDFRGLESLARVRTTRSS